MSIINNLNNITDQECRNILIKILESYLNPAFGSLPKREIDIMMFEILEDIKVINETPELYSLVRDLRVTRSKARSLLYDRELRKYQQEELDELVKKALMKPIISKNGDEFKLEIESPLVTDHLRSKIKKLGFLSDGSFSPSIVRLPLKAVTALIASYLSDSEKNEIKTILVRAGVPDGSFSGILKAVFKKVAGKVAADTGEELFDQAEEYISPILTASVEIIEDKVREMFTYDSEEENS